MFNPSELEGEVDHAFFDSDCDSSSGHGMKRVEESLKVDKKTSAILERSNVKCTLTEKGDIFPSSWKSGRYLNELKVNNGRRHRKKESSKRPGLLSTSFPTHKVSTDSSDSDEHSSGNFEKPRVSLLGLLAETRNVEGKDPSSKSFNKNEKEPRAFVDSSKGRNEHPLKIHAQSWNTENPLPSSTENCAVAGSDSSDSNSPRSLESPTHPKDSKSYVSSKIRRTTVESSVLQQGQTTPTRESDYSMTDVSPLSSPRSSPHHSLDFNHEEAEESPHDEQREESVTSSGLSNIHEESSDQETDDSFLSLESQLRDKLVVHGPGAMNRKNYSFSNEEVSRIDRENQRLLRQLSHLSPGHRLNSAMLNYHVTSPSPVIRLPHSAHNRKREQKRIERENLALLKRLESVKPTPGLRRSKLLADYQHGAKFCGVPSYPISPSAGRKECLWYRTSSDPKPVSSRAVSVSNTIGASRPKKTTTARPAWC